MKNLILYIACLIYTAYVAIMHDSNSVAILFFVELFVPVPLFLLALFQCMKMEISFHFPISVVERGNANILEIKIVNALPFPVTRLRITLIYENKLLQEKSKKIIKTSVGKKQTKILPLTLTNNTCGIAAVTLKKIRIYDYLGFLFTQKKYLQTEELTILPIMPESTLNISPRTRDFPLESDHFDPSKGGNDPSEVFQIREYQKGDRPQNIHWKLTAKSNDLMVKEFSRPIGCAVILFLNSMTLSDSFIEIFSSISNQMIRKECPHYVAWYHAPDKDLERFMVEDLENLYELIFLLYKKPPSRLEDNFLYLYKDKYKNETFSTWLHLEDSLVLSKNGEPVTIFTTDNFETELLNMSLNV